MSRRPFRWTSRAAPEFVLTKHAGPVFTGPQNVAADPSVVRESTGLLRLFYTGPDYAMLRGVIAQATSVDGVTWTPAKPVIRGALGTWAETLETAAALKTATGHQVYFSGYNETVSFPSSAFAAIGMSRSVDGGATYSPPGAPILTSTPRGPDNDALFSPVVVRTTTGFAMLYVGHCYTDCPTGPSVSILGATSPDGRTWTKVATPVLTALPQFEWMNGGAAEPDLVRGPDAAYYLFFTGIDGVSDGRALGVARSATTPFGPWVVHPVPILLPSLGTFDAGGVLAPSVLIEGDRVRLWYLGVSATEAFAIGYAEANVRGLQAAFR